VNMKSFSISYQLVHEFPESGSRTIAARSFTAKTYPAVDIPASDQDGFFRSDGGAGEGIKICRAVDQKSHSLCFPDTPAIFPLFENWFHKLSKSIDG
jgi:hypothetical protein